MSRICCFCETWGSGGIESFLANMITYMDLSELEIDIAVVQKKESIFTERLQALGVSFYELSGSRNRLLLNSKMFCDLLRERKYDVVHLNAFHAGALHYLHLAKKHGVPIRIAHSHNTALRKSKTVLFKLMVHEVAKRIYTQCATEHWACSTEAAKFLLSPITFQKQSFKLVPNGIDTERFKYSERVRKEMRAELSLNNSFVIGNIGRLCYQKNQKFLIELLPELLSRYPEALLLLVGDGEDKDYLVAYAKKLNVNDKVIFEDATDSPERFYCAFDVFAFPSHFEGFGIVAIEAQCAGLPVVCSDEVPSAALILKTAKSVSLSCGSKIWASEICNSYEQRLSRENAFEQIHESGYGIAEVAKWIKSRFLSTVEE